MTEEPGESAEEAVEEAREELKRVMSGPPREEKYSEEAEKIFELLRNRGDQRIGQAVMNAARMDLPELEKEEDETPSQFMDRVKAAESSAAFNIEDDELAEKLEELLDR